MSPRSGALAEGREAVAARLRRLEDLGVVRQVEGAAHRRDLRRRARVGGGLSARRERLLGRVGDGDHVAAAVAVAADGTDRLAELEVRVRLHDALRREHGVELADARHASGRERAGLRR